MSSKLKDAHSNRTYAAARKSWCGKLQGYSQKAVQKTAFPLLHIRLQLCFLFENFSSTPPCSTRHHRLSQGRAIFYTASA
ncbi:hypothetical protein [Comamonas kerstersii]|uniref:hypothetical protein n=1 Tax=Comamonas kerstersii TaxID=225992 RepID=UPI001033577C|nr:hypothetical protein [Comamonas kerstersii]